MTAVGYICTTTLMTDTAVSLSCILLDAAVSTEASVLIQLYQPNNAFAIIVHFLEEGQEDMWQSANMICLHAEGILLVYSMAIAIMAKCSLSICSQEGPGFVLGWCGWSWWGCNRKMPEKSRGKAPMWLLVFVIDCNANKDKVVLIDPEPLLGGRYINPINSSLWVSVYLDCI